MSQGMKQGDLQGFFGQGFNPATVPPADDFDVLPPDKYPVMCEEAEVKPTKAGTGYYIALLFTIIDGAFKGRKLWGNININNPSQKCVEIGLRSLAALGQAVGIPNIVDTAQLKGKACLAHVKVKNGDNEIRTYSRFEDAASVQPPRQYTQPPQQPAYTPPASPAPGTYPPQQPQYQPPQQPVAGGKPPWQR
jgi:hypothetical protein